MNAPHETSLEVSFWKALLLSTFCMACMVTGFFAIGMPMQDPLFKGFLVVMIIVMSPVFAAGICFMLRCKISHEGLRPAVPTLYQWVLRWEDVSGIRKVLAGPFITIKGRHFNEFCILPRPFLLKHPESLKQLIEQYAPEENILRKKLAD